MGLFDEQVAREPNNYPWTQDFIEKMHQGFWTASEFDFKSDYHNFKKEMPEDHKRMLVKTLSAIGQIEIAVKRFWALLGENLPHPSMFDLGYTMANTEVIHNQAYEKLLKTLKLTKVFQENLSEPVVIGRVNYLKKHNKIVYEDQRKQYVYSIILFTLFVENVSLFSQFYIVLWLNKYMNILKDTSQQIQYTRNEEMIHALVGMKLVNTLREEYPELFDEELINRIKEETISAFEAESAMIDWIMSGVDIEGYDGNRLNADVLKEFIKNRINDSLNGINMPSAFDVDKDLLEQTEWFNEELLGNNMTDFFHKKPVDYAKKNKVVNESELFEDELF